MRQWTEKELSQVLNSDFKLWEFAETEENGTSITKSLNLPLGIGEVTVTLEDIHDATTKRGAVEAFGDYVRGLVRERTDDEEVTARAEAARQKAKQDDLHNGIYVPDQRVQNPQAKEETVQSTVQAHDGDDEGDGGLGAVLFAKRAALRARVHGVRADLARWTKELKALDAACAALEEDDDTPPDTGTPEQRPALKVGGSEG
jgi:hypothetical protein